MMPWNTALPIFVADDEAATLDALRFMLTCAGYRVATFASGSELLAVVTDALPGLILLDHVMPGLDGLQVCGQLSARGVTAPVILITGHPDPAIRQRARDAGVPLVEKPAAQDLLRAIEAMPLP